MYKAGFSICYAVLVTGSMRPKRMDIFPDRSRSHLCGKWMRHFVALALNCEIVSCAIYDGASNGA